MENNRRNSLDMIMDFEFNEIETENSNVLLFLNVLLNGQY